MKSLRQTVRTESRSGGDSEPEGPYFKRRNNGPASDDVQAGSSAARLSATELEVPVLVAAAAEEDGLKRLTAPNDRRLIRPLLVWVWLTLGVGFVYVHDRSSLMMCKVCCPKLSE